MIRNNNHPDDFNTVISQFCKHIAGQSQIAGISLADSSSKNSRDRVVYEVMLVVRRFQPRLMSYLKTVQDKTVIVFAVDQWIFEQDIERGFLGEAVASKLIFPHTDLFGGKYLHQKEVALKKRLIVEMLQNIVINFPELAQRIQIMPQYFMYEAFSNRIRVFPLLAYDLGELTSCLENNESLALGSYMEALEQLEAEGSVNTLNKYVTISSKFISECQNPALWILNLSKNMPRTLFASMFGVLPQFMNIVSQNGEAFLPTFCS